MGLKPCFGAKYKKLAFCVIAYQKYAIGCKEIYVSAYRWFKGWKCGRQGGRMWGCIQMQMIAVWMRAWTFVGDKTASPDWPQSCRVLHWSGTRLKLEDLSDKRGREFLVLVLRTLSTQGMVARVEKALGCWAVIQQKNLISNFFKTLIWPCKWYK